MGLAKPSDFKTGKLTGTVYLFDLKDDVLTEHYHAKGQGHITFVVKGSIKIESKLLEKNWERIGKAGDFFDLPDDQWHEFTALEDGTKILNIQKGEA
jgi:quercetin dioxygenase-like cupin family protein